MVGFVCFRNQTAMTSRPRDVDDASTQSCLSCQTSSRYYIVVSGPMASSVCRNGRVPCRV